MTFQELSQKLQAKFGSDVTPATPEKGEPCVIVAPGRIVEACRFLRDDPDARMDYLMDLAGADYPAKQQIEVVYHLCSLTKHHRITLKVQLPREAPKVATVEGVWPAANWHERECYDMFGVIFEGHSDFRRILLPDDWEGFPLRKDYKVQEFWHGMKVETDH